MAIDVQSKKFDLGELLGATFQLLKSQFMPVLKASLLPGGIILAVSVVFGAGIFLVMSLTGPINTQRLASLPMSVLIIASVIQWIMFAVAFSLIITSVIQLTADSCGGQAFPTTRIVLKRAWGRLAAFWGTVALLILLFAVFAGLIFLLGSVVAQVPLVGFLLSLVMMLAIYAAGIYVTFTLEAVSLRGLSGMDAIRTSFYLVKGRFWKTFGYLFVLGLVGGVAFLIPMVLIQVALEFVTPQIQSGNWAMMGLAVVLAICMILIFFLFQLFILIGKTLTFLAWESSKFPGPELIQKE